MYKALALTNSNFPISPPSGVRRRRGLNKTSPNPSVPAVVHRFSHVHSLCRWVFFLIIHSLLRLHFLLLFPSTCSYRASAGILYFPPSLLCIRTTSAFYPDFVYQCSLISCPSSFLITSFPILFHAEAPQTTMSEGLSHCPKSLRGG